MDFNLAKEQFSKLLSRVSSTRLRVNIQEIDVRQCVNDCEALINTFYSRIPQPFSRQIVSFSFSHNGSGYQRLQGLEGVLKSIVNDIEIRQQTSTAKNVESKHLLEEALKVGENASKKYSDLLDDWNELASKWNALNERVEQELEPKIEGEGKAKRKFRIAFFVVLTILLSYVNYSLRFILGFSDLKKVALIQGIIFIAVFLAYNGKIRRSLFDFGKKHTVEGIGRAYQALILALLTAFLVWAVWYFFKVDLPEQYQQQTSPKTGAAK